MPKYEIEALEKFVVRTNYSVVADSKEEAEQMCKYGDVEYDLKEIKEGEEEWIETVYVEEK